MIIRIIRFIVTKTKYFEFLEIQMLCEIKFEDYPGNLENGIIYCISREKYKSDTQVEETWAKLLIKLTHILK